MSIVEFCAKNKEKRIYIVGKCQRGVLLQKYLEANEFDVDGYLVSKEFNDQVGSFYGKKVICIDNMNETNDVAVILATKAKNYTKVVTELAKQGVREYCFISDQNEYQKLQEYSNFYLEETENNKPVYYDSESYHYTIKRILEYVFLFFSPKSIIDFGCGSGIWLKIAKDILENGITVKGLDYSVTGGIYLNDKEYCSCNLETVDYLGEKYDMAFSIECAEHLDKSAADNFINNLCRASDVILFSAAIKYQGGDHHVNEQFPSYWKEKFEFNGYKCIDCIRPTFWNDRGMDVIYRNNTMLYVNDSIYKDVLNRIVIEHNIDDYIHPYLYSIKIRELLNGNY